jgi:co-chaperonin GroES (HSP10)
MLPQFASTPKTIGNRVIVFPHESAKKTSTGIVLTNSGNPRGTIISIGTPIDGKSDLSALEAGQTIEFLDGRDLKVNDTDGKEVVLKVVAVEHIIAIL